MSTTPPPAAMVAAVLGGFDPRDGVAVTRFYRDIERTHAPASRRFVFSFLRGLVGDPTPEQLDVLVRNVTWSERSPRRG